jgi:hypothetical protein
LKSRREFPGKVVSQHRTITIDVEAPALGGADAGDQARQPQLRVDLVDHARIANLDRDLLPAMESYAMDLTQGGRGARLIELAKVKFDRSAKADFDLGSQFPERNGFHARAQPHVGFAGSALAQELAEFHRDAPCVSQQRRQGISSAIAFEIVAGVANSTRGVGDVHELSAAADGVRHFLPL